jgi:hypothetical protein
VLQTADVGSRMRVIVTATNGGGSAAATSEATGIVATATAPVSSSPTASKQGGKKRRGTDRTLATEGQPLLEWEGRLFSSAGEFHRYLQVRKVNWTRLLDRHPAVVTALGLPSVKWDGRTFYSQASLRGWLDRSGVSYTSWAKAHPNAAAALSATARASGQTRLLAQTLVTWDGIRFTTAAGLRTHLQSQGVDWATFIAGHPAVAQALGLGEKS